MQVKAKNQARILSKTEAGANTTGGLLLHFEFHIDQIIMAGHFGCFYAGLTEVTQPFQTDSALLNRGLGGGCAFHLAHLPAQHFIGSFLIALKADTANVGSLPGVHEKLHGDRVVFFINLGNTCDFGKVVALVAEAPCQVVFGTRYQLLGEGLSLADQQETPQVCFRENQIT